ncbi:hypothetical protein GA0115254_118085 [Streptomyces sp. Ncost-T10-10d]|nr:hypothetical protein GA0115254_118085 [Streptomyces sp. Ncost-T10-10d]
MRRPGRISGKAMEDALQRARQACTPDVVELDDDEQGRAGPAPISRHAALPSRSLLAWGNDVLALPVEPAAPGVVEDPVLTVPD